MWTFLGFPAFGEGPSSDAAFQRRAEDVLVLMIGVIMDPSVLARLVIAEWVFLLPALDWALLATAPRR